MKTIWYNKDPERVHDALRLVSTRWQLNHIRSQHRKNTKIVRRKPVYNLESFASGLVTTETVDKAQGLHILRRLLREIPVGRYQSIAQTAGFSEALFSWISALDGENIGPDALTGPQKDLETVYREYRAALAQRQIAGREEQMREAATRVKQQTIGPVVVTGFIDFRQVELDFLDALAENNDVHVYLDVYDSDAYTQEREAEFIRRGWNIQGEQVLAPQYSLPRLRTAPAASLLAQAALQEAAVQAAKGLSFDFVVSDDAMAEEIMRAADEAGLQLTRAATISAFHTHVGRDVLALLELCTQPVTPETLDKRRALASFPLVAEGDPGEFEGNFRKEIQQAGDVAAFLIEKIQEFRDSTFPRLLSISDNAHREWKGAEVVLTATEKWKKHEGHSYGFFLAYLRDTLNETKINQPVSMRGTRLLSLQESAHLPVDHRIFVGFDRDFPATEAENFLLREPFVPPRVVMPPPLQYDKEVLRFKNALHYGKNASFVLLRGPEGLSVSPLLASYLPDKADGHIGSRLPRSLQYMSSKATKMQNAVQAEQGEQNPYSAYHLQRQQYGALPAKGLGRSYSASSLNRYHLCPYRYWLAFVLGIEEKGENIYQLRGNIMHTILAAYISRKQEGINHRLEKGQTPAVDTPLIKRLVQAATERTEIPLSPALQQNIREQLIAYLQMDMERLADSRTYRVGPIEEPFSFSIGEGNKRIWLNGKVDRVDQSPKQKDWIGDYKTGGIKSKKEIQRGDDFQLPLYSLSRPEHSHVYYGLLAKGSIRALRSPTNAVSFQKPMFTREEWDTLLEETKIRIIAIDEKIQAGDFSITPSRKACEYCPFSPVCRKEEQV